MSVQFGRWNIDGQPVDPGYLQKAKDMLAPYGPDGEGVYIKDGVGILYRAFHTTKESRKESQPLVTPSGSVLCWDGRLDNREELIQELGEPLAASSTDLDIAAAAYEAKGTACFGKLIGDWALSAWEPKSQSVVLAKDPIGTRHLYYSLDSDQIKWSTILDPLVLLAGKTFELEEEYIAGWLSFFPATHLTPYVGIHSVPSSCFIRLEAGRQTIRKYWDFDPSKRICYKTDGEYEEHFRQVFREAVRRRLRSDSPVLAELSGGMDSSSIVCVADTIIARGRAETPRLDTISYYDDSEPNWNERPYFTLVEQKRGRPGCHIDASWRVSPNQEIKRDGFRAKPSSDRCADEIARRLAQRMISQGDRVLLSGMGGDEFTGGVPTPTPELEDLIVRVRFRTLARQLRLWALTKREPWVHLLFDAIRRFLPPQIVGVSRSKHPAPWLNPNFVKRNRAALQGYEARIRFFGPLPSTQENSAALEALQRQLGCQAPRTDPPYEKRYPYFDRGLMEFLCAIPREQLVSPGQRRSLMRRALVDIAPHEILHRKRKAFAVRTPMTTISAQYASLAIKGRDLESASRQFVDTEAFDEVVRKARSGHEVPVVPLIRTIALEIWLRELRDSGLWGVGCRTAAEGGGEMTAQGEPGAKPIMTWAEQVPEEWGPGDQSTNDQLTEGGL